MPKSVGNCQKHSYIPSIIIVGKKKREYAVKACCSDDFNRKVECLFIFRSLHSLRQWFSEFVEKSIWLHENAENYHSQKKDDSSSDIIWA